MCFADPPRAPGQAAPLPPLPPGRLPVVSPFLLRTRSSPAPLLSAAAPPAPPAPPLISASQPAHIPRRRIIINIINGHKPNVSINLNDILGHSSHQATSNRQQDPQDAKDPTTGQGSSVLETQSPSLFQGILRQPLDLVGSFKSRFKRSSNATNQTSIMASEGNFQISDR